MVLYLIALIFFILYFNSIFLYTDLKFRKVKNIHLLYYIISLTILFFFRTTLDLKIFFYNLSLSLVLLFLFYYFDLLSAGDSKVILLNIVALFLLKKDLTFLIYLGVLFSLLFIYTFIKILFKKDKNLYNKFKKRFNIYIFMFYLASSLTMLLLIVKPLDFILSKIKLSFLYELIIILFKILLVIYLIRIFNKYFIKIFNKFFKKIIYVVLYIFFIFVIDYLFGFGKEDLSFIAIYFFYVYFLNIFYYELLEEVSYHEKNISEIREGDVLFTKISNFEENKVLSSKDIRYLKDMKIKKIKVENIIPFTIFIYLTNIFMIIYYLFFN